MCRSTLRNPRHGKATLAVWPVTPAGSSPAVTSWLKMATLLEPGSSVSQEGYSPTVEGGREGGRERGGQGGREGERGEGGREGESRERMRGRLGEYGNEGASEPGD